MHLISVSHMLSTCSLTHSLLQVPREDWPLLKRWLEYWRPLAEFLSGKIPFPLLLIFVFTWRLRELQGFNQIASHRIFSCSNDHLFCWSYLYSISNSCTHLQFSATPTTLVIFPMPITTSLATSASMLPTEPTSPARWDLPCHFYVWNLWCELSSVVHNWYFLQ